MSENEPVPGLKDRRRRVGLTQQQLGDLAGVHRVTVRQAEIGQPVTASTLVRLNEALLLREHQPVPPAPVSGALWLDLARRVTDSERTYRRLADECWEAHDYLTAVRWRGMADGLALARSHHAEVVAEKRDGA